MQTHFSSSIVPIELKLNLIQFLIGLRVRDLIIFCENSTFFFKVHSHNSEAIEEESHFFVQMEKASLECNWNSFKKCNKIKLTPCNEEALWEYLNHLDDFTLYDPVSFQEWKSIKFNIRITFHDYSYFHLTPIYELL